MNSKKKYIVKITKCGDQTYWYRDQCMIGIDFRVFDYSEDTFMITDGVWLNGCLRKSDCEIISEIAPENDHGKIIRIKIVKAGKDEWYYHFVGEEYDVFQKEGSDFDWITIKHSSRIHKSDCEIIEMGDAEKILRKHASVYFKGNVTGDFILSHKDILPAMEEYKNLEVQKIIEAMKK